MSAQAPEWGHPSHRPLGGRARLSLPLAANLGHLLCVVSCPPSPHCTALCTSEARCGQSWWEAASPLSSQETGSERPAELRGAGVGSGGWEGASLPSCVSLNKA